MKNISRGKMSKIFNINKEKVRYYSDIGLLKGRVNPINNYSEYTIEDVFLLSATLRARYIGTSIAELKEMRQNDEIDIYEDFISSQADKIDKEIARLKEIKAIIEKNKSSVLVAKSFKNNFDFGSMKPEKVRKIFYRFYIEEAIENLIKHKEFMDISEKQKMFITIDLEKENIFSDVDYLYLENDEESHFINYLMEAGIEFKKIEFEENVIRERFLGTAAEMKNYINKIKEHFSLNIELVMINKELTIPNEKMNKYFVEIFIKL